jgi:multidrug resistance efflux pump
MLVVGAIICAAAVTLIYRETRQITTQAFINAPVVTVRAPIPGRTKLVSGLQVGRRIVKGEGLGTVVADTENPRISELASRIAELIAQRTIRQSELEAIDAQIIHRRRELAGQNHRAGVQQVVDVQGARANLALAVADLERTNAVVNESKRRVERSDALRAEGFISSAAFDNTRAEEAKARAAQRASKEAVQRSEIALGAAQQGLQIDGPRGLPYAVTRGQELAQSITDLAARKTQLVMQIVAASSEIAVMQQELAKQSQAELTSPVQGAVWNIDANSGDAVIRQGAVLQLVNCEDRWVEAFFSEKDTARMAVGTRVKVRSYYEGNDEWDGLVTSVRYGTGRVTVGQYVVDPPPEVMRRQLPVRVATARIQVDWGYDDNGAPLCNVGRSVEVLPNKSSKTKF